MNSRGSDSMNQINRLVNAGEYKEALKIAEQCIYMGAYTHAGGNQSAAAKLLGVSRGTFIYKMNNWGALR